MKLKLIKKMKYEWREINFKYVYAGMILNFLCTLISLLYGGRINLISVSWLLLATMIGGSTGIIFSNIERFREIYKYKGIFLYILMMIFNILWMPLLYRANNPVLAFVDIFIIGIFVFFIIYYYSKINYISTFVMLLYFVWILFVTCVNITYIH